MNAVRLLIDPPLPGAVNMARDEALLDACRLADTPPVLRFYAWQTATVSLGYFQEFGEFERLEPPAGKLPVVRRTTGGGAILHDLEVTYSIVMPLAHPLIVGRPHALYRLAHAAILGAIDPRLRLHGKGSDACGTSSQRGPFFCFARRHDLDLVIDDSSSPDGVSKIAGSAQRRTTSAVLQHGSIILDSRFAQHPVATWKQVTGAMDFGGAVHLLIPAFEKALSASLSRSEWLVEEQCAADRIQSRYEGTAWTVHRRRE